jgi:hypothetical protein
MKRLNDFLIKYQCQCLFLFVLIYYFQLLQVLLLGLDHREDETVTLSHALRVRRLDVLLHDLLPATAAQPAAKKALHLLDLPQLDRVLHRVAEVRQVGRLDDAHRLRVLGRGASATETASADGRRRE